MRTVSKILAVGLNPAYQRTLVFDGLRIGKVNRARREVISAGGKAVHFGIAANAAAPGSATVAAFFGGDTGAAIQRELAAAGTDTIGVRMDEDTRTCTTLIDEGSGVTTELVGPSAMVSEEQAAQMRGLLLAALPRFDALALCGTYPAGIREDLFIELAEAHGPKPLMLDAFHGVERLLQTGHVDLLKLNVDEGSALTGAESPVAIAARAFERYSLTALLLTDGPQAAWAFEAGAAWRIDLPSIEAVNPIGAGDTCAAVTMTEWLRGEAPLNAFVAGLAAASASCLTLEGGRFDRATARRLAALMTPVAITA